MLRDEQRLELVLIGNLRPQGNLLTHLGRIQIRRITAELKTKSHLYSSPESTMNFSLVSCTGARRRTSNCPRASTRELFSPPNPSITLCRRVAAIHLLVKSD